jgi:hypothetical protein
MMGFKVHKFEIGLEGGGFEIRLGGGMWLEKICKMLTIRLEKTEGVICEEGSFEGVLIPRVVDGNLFSTITRVE